MSKASETFNPRTMLWMVLASVLAAAAFFVLSTYAPDFRMPGKAGAMPLSKGGSGYAGLLKLIELTDQPPVLIRKDPALADPALLIVPLTIESDPKQVEQLAENRAGKATLFILPKWFTLPDRLHPGWEYRIGHLPAAMTDRLLGALAKAKLEIGGKPGPLAVGRHVFAAPVELQSVADTEPYIAAGPGQALVTQIEGTPHYILTDPDLLNNAGLADPARAEAALSLIRRLKPNDDPVMVDLTLSGGGDHSNDLQKLLIEPPFLALTLTLLVAAGLALAHGFVRFGPPRAEGRAIAFGKYALVDTTARLFRRAGRLAGLGDKYAALMRQRAAARLGAPSALTGKALDAWLDARDGETADGFTARARAVEETTTEPEMRARAEALHDWIDIRHTRKKA